MRDLDVITLALTLALVFVFVRVLTAAGQQIISCKHRISHTTTTIKTLMMNKKKKRNIKNKYTTTLMENLQHVVHTHTHTHT